MDYLVEQYIGYVSSRLENFHKKSSSLYNFRCPFCGDSERNPHKARGYLIERNNEVFFYCHKCHAPIGNFQNFLKKLDPSLYTEFIKDKYSSSDKKVETFELPKQDYKPRLYDTALLSDLTSVADLAPIDSVRVYVRSRRIPEELYGRLFACPFFKKFTNSLIPDKFNAASLRHEEQRLIIPFFDEDRKMFAYAGRSLDVDPYLRYINIVLDETKPKLFGLDRWNKKVHTNVVEGPIDSFFLTNCIASAGGSLITDLKGSDPDQFTIIYDNEPFSKDTKHKIERAIEAGFPVCIWPDDLPYKDINKMFLEGMGKDEIERVIKQNTFKDLEARLRLTFWSKK